MLTSQESVLSREDRRSRTVKLSTEQKKSPVKFEELDREGLVEQYRYFVYSIVKKIRVTLHKYVEFDEMVSYGMIGLMEAADRFDPSRGIAFTTFSYYRIRGAIFDGLRQMGVLMRSPKGKWVQKESNLNDLVREEAENSKDGTVDEDLSEVGRVIDKIIPAYLLSLSDETTPEVVDDAALPSETAEFKGTLSLVHGELRKLDERERTLIESLYFKNITTTALAEQMGVTKSWVSRLHSKAIKKIRSNLVKSGVMPRSR